MRAEAEPGFRTPPGARAGLRGLASDVLGRLRRHDPFLLAAGLTFYAAVAVVPLCLLALAIAGVVIGRDTVAGLTEQVAGYFPGAPGIRDLVAAAGDMGAGIGVMSFLAGLVPAAGYGEGLVRVFDRLAEVDRARKLLRGRLLVLALLAALVGATLLGLAAMAVLPGALGTGGGARALGIYLAFVVGWAMSSLVLAVMYRLFSPRPLDAATTAWAAATAGSFFTGTSLGWLLVLRFGTDIGPAYGGSPEIGTVVLIAVYLLVVQAIVVVGYALALALADRAGHPLRALPQG